MMGSGQGMTAGNESRTAQWGQAPVDSWASGGSAKSLPQEGQGKTVGALDGDKDIESNYNFHEYHHFCKEILICPK